MIKTHHTWAACNLCAASDTALQNVCVIFFFQSKRARSGVNGGGSSSSSMCGRSPEHFTLFSWTGALGGLKVGVVEFLVRTPADAIYRNISRSWEIIVSDSLPRLRGRKKTIALSYLLYSTTCYFIVIYDRHLVQGERLISG